MVRPNLTGQSFEAVCFFPAGGGGQQQQRGGDPEAAWSDEEGGRAEGRVREGAP